VRRSSRLVASFELKDVKMLHGEHLSRAIGRIAGQGGKTKYTIENATRTRIVLADTHVHILGCVGCLPCRGWAVVLRELSCLLCLFLYLMHFSRL
jgi:hypothetical protein